MGTIMKLYFITLLAVLSTEYQIHDIPGKVETYKAKADFQRVEKLDNTVIEDDDNNDDDVVDDYDDNDDDNDVSDDNNDTIKKTIYTEYYDEGYVNTREERLGHQVKDPHDKNSKLVFGDIMTHKRHPKNDELLERLSQEYNEYSDDIEGYRDGSDRKKMDAIKGSEYRWSVSLNQPIPFTISHKLGKSARNAIRNAMWEIENNTCIGFRQKKSGDKDYIRFEKDNGCWSYVGRQEGMHIISIGKGCEYKKIVEHEIIHALGFWHEPSRPDRDKYVVVHFDNIIDGKENNFKKQPSNAVTYLGQPYDYRSIMHYRSYAFSRNGKPTIEAKKGWWFTKPSLGQSTLFGEMSEIDKKQIRKMYNCSRKTYSRRRNASKHIWGRRRRWLGKKK